MATAVTASLWPMTRLMQRILEVQQTLTLVLGQLSDRNTGPAGDNGGNIVLGDSSRGDLLCWSAHSFLRASIASRLDFSSSRSLAAFSKSCPLTASSFFAATAAISSSSCFRSGGRGQRWTGGRGEQASSITSIALSGR